MVSQGLTRKLTVELPVPAGDDHRDDKCRLLDSLNLIVNEPVRLTYRALRKLQQAIRNGNWKLDVSLAWNGTVWQIVDLAPAGAVRGHYGYAVDLGSTSVILQLLDADSGSVLAEESMYNRQIRFGEDILSRIFYCKDAPEHLEEVQKETCETIRELMAMAAEDAGIMPEDCISMVVSGNTTMIHFLLGLDPFMVFHEPYTVGALDPGFIPAAELGFAIKGYVYCVPAKANYLGGDILSGMIATELYKQDGISVFFDIGTNGELVVGNQSFLLCGAGAAGPALEGGSVSTGMRAGEGAVDAIRIVDGRFHYHVIGTPETEERIFGPEESVSDAGAGREKIPVRGICGSGIVDLLSTLFLNGWVDSMGMFLTDASLLITSVTGVNGEQEAAVQYAPGLTFTRSDIVEFMRTKAAAVTMMEYILGTAGIGTEDVKRYYMTGAFGTHVDKESAVSIGMYPDVPREEILLAGNTSLEGARKILLSRDTIADIRDILELMDYVQFGAVANFVDLMNAASALPHTDTSRYPSVMARFAKGSDRR